MSIKPQHLKFHKLPPICECFKPSIIDGVAGWIIDKNVPACPTCRNAKLPVEQNQ